MIYLLRTFEDPFYSASYTLDGTSYLFEFRYNQRASCWYFSVSLEDGTLLVAGVKLVCNVSLLSRFADVSLPPGVVFATSTSADKSPPSLKEIGDGKRVQLVYFDASEFK